MTVKTIWKFVLSLSDEQVVPMPEGSQLLCAQMQGTDICVWASVDTERRFVGRRFVIVGTGNAGPNFDGLIYLSTIQQSQFVWHIFYAPEVKP